MWFLLLFIGEFLGRAVKPPKASIPWTKLSEDPDSFIHPDSSPDLPDFHWADPSKIRLSFIDQLWEFYYDRIQTFDEPITFLSLKSDRPNSDQDDERQIQMTLTNLHQGVKKGKGKARAKSFSSSTHDGEDFGKAIDEISSDLDNPMGEGPSKHSKGFRGNGESYTQDNVPSIHPDSPASCSSSDERQKFLLSLCNEKAYVAIVNPLSKAQVRLVLTLYSDTEMELGLLEKSSPSTRPWFLPCMGNVDIF